MLNADIFFVYLMTKIGKIWDCRLLRYDPYNALLRKSTKETQKSLTNNYKEAIVTIGNSKSYEG